MKPIILISGRRLTKQSDGTGYPLSPFIGGMGVSEDCQRDARPTYKVTFAGGFLGTPFCTCLPSGRSTGKKGSEEVGAKDL